MGMEVFDPASAKAIEEAAKTGSKVIDAGTGLAAYLDRVLGRLPDNLVGFLGDYLEHKRLRRAAHLWAETKEHLRQRGVTEPLDVSPSRRFTIGLVFSFATVSVRSQASWALRIVGDQFRLAIFTVVVVGHRRNCRSDYI